MSLDFLKNRPEDDITEEPQDAQGPVRQQNESTQIVSDIAQADTYDTELVGERLNDFSHDRFQALYDRQERARGRELETARNVIESRQDMDNAISTAADAAVDAPDVDDPDEEGEMSPEEDRRLERDTVAHDRAYSSIHEQRMQMHRDRTADRTEGEEDEPVDPETKMYDKVRKALGAPNASRDKLRQDFRQYVGMEDAPEEEVDAELEFYADIADKQRTRKTFDHTLFNELRMHMYARGEDDVFDITDEQIIQDYVEYYYGGDESVLDTEEYVVEEIIRYGQEQFDNDFSDMERITDITELTRRANELMETGETGELDEPFVFVDDLTDTRHIVGDFDRLDSLQHSYLHRDPDEVNRSVVGELMVGFGARGSAYLADVMLEGAAMANRAERYIWDKAGEMMGIDPEEGGLGTAYQAAKQTAVGRTPTDPEEEVQRWRRRLRASTEYGSMRRSDSIGTLGEDPTSEVITDPKYWAAVTGEMLTMTMPGIAVAGSAAGVASRVFSGVRRYRWANQTISRSLRGGNVSLKNRTLAHAIKGGMEAGVISAAYEIPLESSDAIQRLYEDVDNPTFGEIGLSVVAGSVSGFIGGVSAMNLYGMMNRSVKRLGLEQGEEALRRSILSEYSRRIGREAGIQALDTGKEVALVNMQEFVKDVAAMGGYETDRPLFDPAAFAEVSVGSTGMSMLFNTAGLTHRGPAIVHDVRAQRNENLKAVLEGRRNRAQTHSTRSRHGVMDKLANLNSERELQEGTVQVPVDVMSDSESARNVVRQLQEAGRNESDVPITLVNRDGEIVDEVVGVKNAFNRSRTWQDEQPSTIENSDEVRTQVFETARTESAEARTGAPEFGTQVTEVEGGFETPQGEVYQTEQAAEHAAKQAIFEGAVVEVESGGYLVEEVTTREEGEGTVNTTITGIDLTTGQRRTIEEPLSIENVLAHKEKADAIRSEVESAMASQESADATDAEGSESESAQSTDADATEADADVDADADADVDATDADATEDADVTDTDGSQAGQTDTPEGDSGDVADRPEGDASDAAESETSEGESADEENPLDDTDGTRTLSLDGEQVEVTEEQWDQIQQENEGFMDRKAAILNRDDLSANERDAAINAEQIHFENRAMEIVGISEPETSGRMFHGREVTVDIDGSRESAKVLRNVAGNVQIMTDSGDIMMVGPERLSTVRDSGGDAVGTIELSALQESDADLVVNLNDRNAELSDASVVEVVNSRGTTIMEQQVGQLKAQYAEGRDINSTRPAPQEAAAHVTQDAATESNGTVEVDTGDGTLSIEGSVRNEPLPDTVFLLDTQNPNERDGDTVGSDQGTFVFHNQRDAEAARTALDIIADAKNKQMIRFAENRQDLITRFVDWAVRNLDGTLSKADQRALVTEAVEVAEDAATPSRRSQAVMGALRHVASQFGMGPMVSGILNRNATNGTQAPQVFEMSSQSFADGALTVDLPGGQRSMVFSAANKQEANVRTGGQEQQAANEIAEASTKELKQRLKSANHEVNNIDVMDSAGNVLDAEIARTELLTDEIQRIKSELDSRNVAYRIDTDTAIGLPVQTARRAVERVLEVSAEIIAGGTDGTGQVVSAQEPTGDVDVYVVDTATELPFRLIRSLKETGSDLSSLRGVIDKQNGNVYVVASQMNTSMDAVRTVAHELFGHRGLSEMLGDTITPVMDDIYSNFSNQVFEGNTFRAAREGETPFVQMIAETYGFDLSTQAGKRQAAEELVAHMAERGFQGSMIERVIAKVREFLREVGRRLGFDMRISDTDIRKMLRDARQHVLRGESDSRVAGIYLDRVEYEANSPMFFSELATTINDIDFGGGQMTGQEAIAAIDAANLRYSEAEIAFSGVREWLQSQDNVTKDDITSYLTAQQVTVNYSADGKVAARDFSQFAQANRAVTAAQDAVQDAERNFLIVRRNTLEDINDALMSEYGSAPHNMADVVDTVMEGVRQVTDVESNRSKLDTDGMPEGVQEIMEAANEFIPAVNEARSDLENARDALSEARSKRDRVEDSLNAEPAGEMSMIVPKSTMENAIQQDLEAQITYELDAAQDRAQEVINEATDLIGLSTDRLKDIFQEEFGRSVSTRRIITEVLARTEDFGQLPAVQEITQEITPDMTEAYNAARREAVEILSEARTMQNGNETPFTRTMQHWAVDPFLATVEFSEQVVEVDGRQERVLIAEQVNSRYEGPATDETTYREAMAEQHRTIRERSQLMQEAENAEREANNAIQNDDITQAELQEIANRVNEINNRIESLTAQLNRQQREINQMTPDTLHANEWAGTVFRNLMFEASQKGYDRVTYNGETFNVEQFGRDMVANNPQQTLRLTTEGTYTLAEGAQQTPQGSPQTILGLADTLTSVPISQQFRERAQEAESLFNLGENVVYTESFKSWFGDWQNDSRNSSKVTDEHGQPQVLYHGTSYDFQAADGSVEVNTALSEESNVFWLADEADNSTMYAEASNMQNDMTLTSEMMQQAQEQGISLQEMYDRMPREQRITEGANLMPFYVNMRNPANLTELGRTFDFGEFHQTMQSLGVVIPDITDVPVAEAAANLELELTVTVDMVDGAPIWTVLEDLGAYEAIQNAGYDGVIMRDTDPAGVEHDAFGIFDPNQVKSATGNSGEFSTTNNDIRRSEGESFGQNPIHATDIVNAVSDALGITIARDDTNLFGRSRTVEPGRMQLQDFNDLNGLFEGMGEVMFNRAEDAIMLLSESQRAEVYSQLEAAGERQANLENKDISNQDLLRKMGMMRLMSDFMQGRSLRDQAPAVEAALQDIFSNETREALSHVRDLFKAYTEQDALSRFDAKLNLRQPTRWEKVKDYMSLLGPNLKRLSEKAYEQFVDPYYPLYKAVRDINGGRMPDNITQDAYSLMRLVAGSRDVATKRLMDGIYINDEKIAPGLREVLIGIANNQERLDLFQGYAVARRAMELHEQRKNGERGPEFGIPITEAEARAKMEQVEQSGHIELMQQKFEMLQEYNRGLIERAVYEGYLNRKTANLINRMNQNYIPWQRVFNGDPMQPNRGQSGNAFQRMYGNEDLVIDNPIANIMRNTFSLTKAMMRNQAMQAMHNMAQRAARENNEAVGSHVQIVSPETRGVQVHYEQMLSELRKNEAIDNQTVDKLESMFESDPTAANEFLSFYLPDTNFTQNGNIVRVKVDGETKYLRLSNDLYESIDNAENPLEFSQTGWFNVLSWGATTLRAGATAYNPAFGLVNWMRDYVQRAIQSDRPDANTKDLLMDPIAMLGSMFKADFMNGENTEFERVYRRFLNSGAGMATISSYDMNRMNQAMRDITRPDLREDGNFLPTLRTLGDFLKYRFGVHQRGAAETASHAFKRNVADPLAYFNERMENVNRLDEFSAVYDDAIADGKSTREAELEAAYAARNVTIDFSRLGHTMYALNRITPFANSVMQGFDRFIDRLVTDPTMTMMRVMKYIAIPSAIVASMNLGNRHYEDQSDHDKDNYWLVPDLQNGERDEDGQVKDFVRIPKPHIWGVFFGSSIERFIHWAGQTGEYEALQDWTDFGALFQNIAEGGQSAFDEGTAETQSLNDAFMPFRRSVAEQMPLQPRFMTDEDATSQFFGTFANIAMPTSLVVPMEIAFNHSVYHGNNIMPQSIEQSYETYERYNARTSKTARYVAQAAKRNLNIELNPMMIDHAVSNYTAGMGQATVQLIDRALPQKQDALMDIMAAEEEEGFVSRMMPEDNETLRSVGRYVDALGSITITPITRRFISNREDRGAGAVSRFFEISNEAQLKYNQYTSYREADGHVISDRTLAYRRENEGLIAIGSDISQAQSKLSELFQQMRTVERASLDHMDMEEKAMTRDKIWEAIVQVSREYTSAYERAINERRNDD